MYLIIPKCQRNLHSPKTIGPVGQLISRDHYHHTLLRISSAVTTVFSCLKKERGKKKKKNPFVSRSLHLYSTHSSFITHIHKIYSKINWHKLRIHRTWDVTILYTTELASNFNSCKIKNAQLRGTRRYGTLLI